MSQERTEIDERLDAREIDGEPFEEIMAELNELSADESLLLINSFEPAPLYSVLEDRGYSFETAQVGRDEWHVEIEET